MDKPNHGRKAPDITRLPPSSEEAEAGVLGCILSAQKPADIVAEAMAALKTVEAMYDMRHRILLDCLVDMADAGDVIDTITVQQLLKDRMQMADIGGLAYLSSLPEAAISAGHLMDYVKIVHDKYILRRIIQTCTEAVGKAYQHQGEIEELLGSVEREVLKIRGDTTSHSKVTIEEYSIRAMHNIQAAAKRSGGPLGISTGLIDLDKLSFGLQPGDYFTIAGRPSSGKTSLCMNIAEEVCLNQGLPVAVFSLEMTGESLAERMICSRARVSMRYVAEGDVKENEMDKLKDSSAKLAASNLHIEDISDMSILQLRARARKLWNDFGIRLFVIDYLQLLHTTNRRCDSRQEEIADISSGIKALAKELKVPVVAAAQLNREMDKEKERRPRLSDLRGSGSLEQDADKIGLLWRKVDDEKSQAGGGESQAHPVTLILAKHRSGPTGEVGLTFLKSYTKFESAAKIDQEDLPKNNGHSEPEEREERQARYNQHPDD